MGDGGEKSERRVRRREIEEWEGRVEVSERVVGTGSEIYCCLLFAGGYDIYYESEREREDGEEGRKTEGKQDRMAAQVRNLQQMKEKMIR